MILDGYLMFSNAQNLALAAAAYDSSNIIDLGLVGGIPATAAHGGGARDIGIGDKPAMKILVQVTTGFTSAGAATLTVSLQGAEDAGNNTPGAYTIMTQSSAYALATAAVIGTRLLDQDMPRPAAGQGVPRYLKLVYTIGAFTMTAGAISAFLVLDRYDQIENSNAVQGAYPPGVIVAN